MGQTAYTLGAFVAIGALLAPSSALVAPMASRHAVTPASLRRSSAHALRSSPLRSVATLPGAVEPVGYDAWAKDFDYDGFRGEVHALGQRLGDGQGETDVKHLKKMIAWSNAFGAMGVATMWMSSPVGRLLSVIGFSTWTCTRWTMIGHHICHGGYNRQDDTGRFTSKGFAIGTVYRRARDWLDWMLPEAWNVEHNNLHHFRLSESGDPDLVERNLEVMREFRAPRPIKYAAVAALAAMWKWYYYAPNTYKQLKIQQMRKEGIEVDRSEAHDAFVITAALLDRKEGAKWRTGPVDFVRSVMGPYLLLRFVALPAPLLLFGRSFFTAAVLNLFLADMLSNIHSFIIIATNHCGKDMYKFENSIAPRSGSFYMRAVTSSANFRTSNGVRADGTARPVHGFTADLNDFFHGWLNYQIEHHAFPQLSMLSYQKAAPEMRAICAKYGVPYVQQNVFRRLKKTADVMVGATSMRPFDASWEHAPDRFTWSDDKDKSAKPKAATPAAA